MATKSGNNMLEFLYDPTVIPVKQRLYFRPEENLQNEQYEGAKAESVSEYQDQKSNSDFYTSRKQSQREATVMDRKTIIASLDVLSQNFSEEDPIGKDLKVMAYAISKMSDEQFGVRTAKAKTFPCPTCGTKVLEQTSFCVKCKKKVKPGKKAADEKAEEKPEVPAAPTPEEMEEKTAMDLIGRWTKKATDAVRRNLIAETCEEDDEKEEKAKEAAVPHDESKETPEQEAAETPAEQAKEKAMGVEQHAVKATVPHDESKETPKQEAAETPAEQAKEKAMGVEQHEVKATDKPCEKCGKNPCECQAAAPAPVPVQAKTVDTSILTATQKVGFIEMEQGMVEAGEMTPEETAKLDSILRFAGLDDMKIEDRAKLGMK